MSAAVERRLEDEDLTPGKKYRVREGAVEAMGPWSNRWTRADPAEDRNETPRSRPSRAKDQMQQQCKSSDPPGEKVQPINSSQDAAHTFGGPLQTAPQ
ncbi:MULTISPECIES: hypothetical protein [unclassified Streptomyces]|uniref:hypothetical protein n=1 Tax=unclassified Streptomyces TaxID=2593676 RepID=UPI00135F147C|nr:MULTISPECIES: hypothetical protein [unclassified Streptomyces]MDN5385068.1 hypothetical protein [Streptomyces sp. LB8]